MRTVLLIACVALLRLSSEALGQETKCPRGTYWTGVGCISGEPPAKILEPAYPPDVTTDEARGAWIKAEIERIGSRVIDEANRARAPESQLRAARAQIQALAVSCEALGYPCHGAMHWSYIEAIDTALVMLAAQTKLQGEATARRAAEARASVPRGAHAGKKALRGVFRDQYDGRPIFMWVLDPTTRRVQLLDRRGATLGSGVIRDIPLQGGPTLKNTAQITVPSGAIYFMRWDDGEMALFRYSGTLVDRSAPMKD